MTNTRIEELTALGAKLDDGVYVFDYSDKLFISEYQLTYLTDEQFNDFLEDVKTAFCEEQTRIFEAFRSPDKDGYVIHPQMKRDIDKL